MYQLSYSKYAIIKHLVLALIATPLILAVTFDQHITSGHVFGIFVGTLYIIGPVGRWAVALTLIGIVWFSCVRLMLILLSDGIAFAAKSSGITVQRLAGRQEFSWNDVIAIEFIVKKSGNRSFRYLRVRVIAGATQRRLDIPTKVLSATDAELETWILNARHVQNRRSPNVGLDRVRLP
ncbi:hypothetical protein [Sphingomonas sp. PAMC 26605]|uniref:hypothetical protein n=1 Tax=Sphingomonas sp. PAMC 26605 TaxID=1112214 RepID=UPI0012F50B2E|nr:hypothetical protein [Sphingomonas sp. PAMC 26605]